MKSSPSFIFEEEVYRLGYRQIAGVDEVGRGCLAGPVVAAAVILHKDHHILGINDSKLLTPSTREKLSEEIYKKSVSVGIGLVEAQVIDRINILEASILAMQKAILSLNPRPDYLLVDGNLTRLGVTPQKSIIGGDRKSQSIAAASIVAKVFRDRLMREYDAKIPGYDFSSHKGYSTRGHIEALEKEGVSVIHRKTFGPVAYLLRAG